MHVVVEGSIDLDQSNEMVNSLTFKVMLVLGILEVAGGVLYFFFF